MEIEVSRHVIKTGRSRQTDVRAALKTRLLTQRRTPPHRLGGPGSWSRWEVAVMNKQADQHRGSLLHFTPCC